MDQHRDLGTMTRRGRELLPGSSLMGKKQQNELDNIVKCYIKSVWHQCWIKFSTTVEC